jgi:hypothetical protein
VSAPGPNSTLLVIGYGSLLSGYGLLREHRGGASALIACDAEPAVALNARRGYAKPSNHGQFLAMDIEPIDRRAPISARAELGGGSAIGVVLLTFDRSRARDLAKREGYDADAFERLIALADEARRPLGEFLMRPAEQTRFDPLGYRSALYELVGYTSAHYVFHPAPLADGRVAIVAISAGPDGSGHHSVESSRRKFGITELLDMESALAFDGFALDRERQIGYFAECLLGGIHGVPVADLIGEYDGEALWEQELAGALARLAPGEAQRFMRATSLDRRTYEARFAAAEPALARLLKAGGLG